MKIIKNNISNTALNEIISNAINEVISDSLANKSRGIVNEFTFLRKKNKNDDTTDHDGSNEENKDKDKDEIATTLNNRYKNIQKEPLEVSKSMFSRFIPYSEEPAVDNTNKGRKGYVRKPKQNGTTDNSSQSTSQNGYTDNSNGGEQGYVNEPSQNYTTDNSNQNAFTNDYTDNSQQYTTIPPYQYEEDYPNEYSQDILKLGVFKDNKQKTFKWMDISKSGHKECFYIDTSNETNYIISDYGYLGGRLSDDENSVEYDRYFDDELNSYIKIIINKGVRENRAYIVLYFNFSLTQKQVNAILKWINEFDFDDKDQSIVGISYDLKSYIIKKFNEYNKKNNLMKLAKLSAKSNKDALNKSKETVSKTIGNAKTKITDLLKRSVGEKDVDVSNLSNGAYIMFHKKIFFNKSKNPIGLSTIKDWGKHKLFSNQIFGILLITKSQYILVAKDFAIEETYDDALKYVEGYKAFNAKKETFSKFNWEIPSLTDMQIISTKVRTINDVLTTIGKPHIEGNFWYNYPNNTYDIKRINPKDNSNSVIPVCHLSKEQLQENKVRLAIRDILFEELYKGSMIE